VQPSEVYSTPSESSAHAPGDGKTGLDKAAHLPERTKIEMPLDIVMSLLRPHELEKLQKYIVSYLGKHWQQ
jgi:hypothetical protein